MANDRKVRRNRKHDDWYYFDQLPRELREALSSSAFLWDSKWCLDKWNSGKWSIPAIVKAVREADLLKAQEGTRYRDGFKWCKVESTAKALRMKPLYG